MAMAVVCTFSGLDALVYIACSSDTVAFFFEKPIYNISDFSIFMFIHCLFLQANGIAFDARLILLAVLVLKA